MNLHTLNANHGVHSWDAVNEPTRLSVQSMPHWEEMACGCINIHLDTNDDPRCPNTWADGPEPCLHPGFCRTHQT